MNSHLSLIFVVLFSSSAILFSGCQKKDAMEDGIQFTIEALPTEPAPLNKVLKIVAPKADEVVGKMVKVYYSSAGFEISEDGFHLHFILDDGEVVEHTKPNSPLIFENLTSGPHVIRAMVVDERHLSVKTSRTFDMVQFFTDEAVGNKHINIGHPMLLLNVPSGTYDLNDSESIKLDFWISSATLGIFDYNVKYSLDGHEGMFELWKSYEIKNLSKGKHKLILDLIDPNGKPVLGNFNHTIRTFIVK